MAPGSRKAGQICAHKLVARQGWRAGNDNLAEASSNPSS